MLKKCSFPRKHFMQGKKGNTTAFSFVYQGSAEMNFSEAFAGTVCGTLLARAGLGWFSKDLV